MTAVSTATTRRAMLAGALIGLPLSVSSASARGSLANRNPDVIIETAWGQRQAAYAAYNELPAENGPVVNGYGPGERELWAIVDEAEEVIRSAVATTPRGVMLQLWCAMYHSVTGREDDKALTRGDFAAIDRIDSGLDWNARLTLAALRSLQTMEA